MEGDGEGDGDGEENDPGRAEDGRRRVAVRVEGEGEVGDNGERDGGREEVDSRRELAQVAHDDVPEDRLGDTRRLDGEEPTESEDRVGERELGVVLDVDDRHAVVDVVADDGDELRDTGDGDEDGVEGESLVRRPL